MNHAEWMCENGWQPQGQRPWGWLDVDYGRISVREEDHPQAALEAATRRMPASPPRPKRINQTPAPAKSCAVVIMFALIASLSTSAWGKTVVTWDFTKGSHGWQGNKHVKGLAVTGEGLAFESTDNDPWIEGPAVDLSGAGMTRVKVRMKSDADPAGELFYGRVFQAGRSVRFTVNSDGQWHDYALVIPDPLGLGTRFRLDPAAGAGHIVVASIEVETLPSIEPPPFETPRRQSRAGSTPMMVYSRGLTLEYYRNGWGSLVIKVAGVEMATGYDGDRIGMVLEDKPQWLALSQGEFKMVGGTDGSIVCQARVRDRDGAQWTVQQQFKPELQTETIVVHTQFVVDKDRQVVHLPWLTLLPGLGTFGERKTQGLFAGLEYLDDEPSSSEADITTAEHIRRVPDPVKVTFPLMAVAYGGRYVGLIWEPSDMVAPVFDSPDRIFNSQAHVMALTAPAVGERRFENSLAARTALTLKANQPLRLRATIIGGSGKTLVPAVQKYVELYPLPKVPEFRSGFDAAVSLLAHGWLDSAINEGGLFRHAVWGDNFRAGPAADAVMYMDWLANQVQDPGLSGRLKEGCDLALTRLPPGQPYNSAVSHTRTPTAPFIFGSVFSYVEQRKAEAQNLLKHFDAQGVKLYQPGKVDYGKTHFAQHANGLAGGDVVRILEAATLSADPQLIEQGLALLDKQTVLYANTVPRGAQTWEVPLHTPDILASAHLVKAYTLGYLLSGKQEHLDQARYWAWTGVPFVYLVNPTAGAIGPYATIAVLGATNWRAPVWFGRPVQWCGLVYSSALHLLSQYDQKGPWEGIAKGITAAGLQMTWPVADPKRQGLLPDVFDLTAQLRDGPAINPGTVQAHVPELFGEGTLYDVKRLSKRGWVLHAPCPIRDLREAESSIAFLVDGWGRKRFYVLFSGIERKPASLMIRPLAPAGRVQTFDDLARLDFQPQQHLLVITLDGPSEVRL